MTATVNPTADETPEQRFYRLRAAADAVAKTTSAIHVKDLDPLNAESYPALTVIKIERQATVEFRAGLSLLADPVLAYSSEIQLRSILEAAAQLWRIYGIRRASLASRRKRAICFEFGSMSGIFRSIQPQVDKGGRRRPSRLVYTTAAGRKSIRLRYKQIADLHVLSCPPDCRGGSSSQISATLQKMSRRHRDLRWAVPMYEVASMTSHQLLQRGLAAADQSTMEIVPMRLEERAANYDRLLTTYALCIDLAARIHMGELTAFRPVAVALKSELTKLYKEIGAIKP